jgi:hypothetical protein
MFLFVSEKLASCLRSVRVCSWSRSDSGCDVRRAGPALWQGGFGQAEQPSFWAPRGQFGGRAVNNSLQVPMLLLRVDSRTYMAVAMAIIKKGLRRCLLWLCCAPAVTL